MKFTLLALATSLALVSAAPFELNDALQARQDSAICLKICGLEKPTSCANGWAPVKQGECWTCCENKPTPTPTPTPSSPPGVCLAICYLTKPDKCSGGMEPRKQGECWTCCSPAPTPTPTPTPPPSDVCLLICYLEKPKTCPAGFGPKRDGECWTCCGKPKTTTPSPPTPTLSTVTLTPPPAQTCLAICHLQKPDCGANGVAVQSGDCWTCCTK